jgi:cytochrome c
MDNAVKALSLITVLLLPVTSWADCDVAAGKKQFNKCSACHSTEPGVQLMGPSLYGLMGRRVGTADGFAFSEAMESADLEWSEETLSAFLENPQEYIPGTVMPFGGIKKAAQREVLGCYIEQLNQ